MAPINWKNERRKISEIKPAEYNPRSASHPKIALTKTAVNATIVSCKTILRALNVQSNLPSRSIQRVESRVFAHANASADQRPKSKHALFAGASFITGGIKTFARWLARGKAREAARFQRLTGWLCRSLAPESLLSKGIRNGKAILSATPLFMSGSIAYWGGRWYARNAEQKKAKTKRFSGQTEAGSIYERKMTGFAYA